MDPLSISSGIAGLLALTGQVIQYLSSVHTASETRQMLLMEVSSTSGLLYSLKDLCQQVDVDSGIFLSLKFLNSPRGPFEQLKLSLERLTMKLAGPNGRSKIIKSMAWPFQQSDVKDLIDLVQRQKTYYILALQGNHMFVSFRRA